jgi:hypothetical protein
MVAIYSFKKFDGHYKPINDDFLRLAKLSVKSAKKYYKTRFYSDQESFDFFTENGIIFDEFVLMGDFVNNFPSQVTISKIYAMMKETEPYIMLDFDVVLFEKLESKNTITYGHPEVEITYDYVGLDSLMYTYDYYLKPFNDHIRKYFNDDEILKMDWIRYPSFCVMMVKTPLLIRNIYKNIFNKISIEDIEIIPPMLLEQFLCHQEIVKNKTDFGFLSNNHYINGDEVIFNEMDMISKKYVHLNINNKKIKDEIIYLESII